LFNKYGLRGKKYHVLTKKREKKRLRKIKEKWLNDRVRTMLHKIMGNLEKNAGKREHNIIFFPLSPCSTKTLLETEPDLSVGSNDNTTHLSVW
jgi:hypothetical protein